MARIDYPAPAGTNPVTGLPTMNLIRMMAHYPAKDVWLGVGGRLISDGVLPPVLREVVILRTGRLCDSDYEVVQHYAFGRAVGLTDEQIRAAELGLAEELDSDGQLVLRMAEEANRDCVLSEATFAAAQSRFSPAEIIEVLLLVAFYRGTACFLRSFDVDLDADGASGAKSALAGRTQDR